MNTKLRAFLGGLIGPQPLYFAGVLITAVFLFVGVFSAVHELSHAAAAAAVDIRVKEIHLTGLSGFSRPFNAFGVRWFADAHDYAWVGVDYAGVDLHSFRAGLVYAAGPFADAIGAVFFFLAWRRRWVVKFFFVRLSLFLAIILAIAVIVNLAPSYDKQGNPRSDGAKLLLVVRRG